jgi:hypothetical protein
MDATLQVGTAEDDESCSGFTDKGFVERNE